MKWPSGSRKAAVEGKRGRDKLNERAEGEDGPPLQGRDLWIKELQGWKEKKKKERKGGRKKRKEEKVGGERRETRLEGIKFPVKLGVRCLERLRPEFPSTSPPPSDSVVELYHPWLTPSTSSTLLVVDCSRCNYNFDRPLLSRI